MKSSIIFHLLASSPTAFATSSVHHSWFLLLGVPPFPDVLPHSSSATPTNASLYCLHSPSTVPFSASSSSYFLRTLSLHSTIISYLHIHHLIFVGPIVLFSYHFFTRTSKTTGLCCAWWHTLPPTLLSCCCRPPVGQALSCAVHSCRTRWFCGSPSSGRTCPRLPCNPFLINISTSSRPSLFLVPHRNVPMLSSSPGSTTPMCALKSHTTHSIVWPSLRPAANLS